MGGFQKNLEFENQPRNQCLWRILTVIKALLFALHVISNEMILSLVTAW